MLNVAFKAAAQHLSILLKACHVAFCCEAFLVHTERTVKVQQKQSQDDDAEQAVDDTAEAVQDGVDQAADAAQEGFDQFAEGKS